MNIVWINIEDVPDELLNSFDSGSYNFNEYLIKHAKSWQSNGEMITYVAVRDGIENATGIYAYASISSTGLMASKKDIVKYLSCCEIRLFAIHKGLRGALDENFIPYSVSLFKSFLQELYYISTHVIGFKAIYLNSNDSGYHLYTDDAIGFMKPEGFIPATDEEKLEIDGCVPLLFFLNDDGVYKIFE